MVPFKSTAAAAAFALLAAPDAGVESFQPQIARSRGGAVANQHRRPTRLEASRSTANDLPFRKIPPYLSSTSSDDESGGSGGRTDPLILRTSKSLRAASWFSWWAQVILTVISSVTFLFARNVMDAQSASNPVELGRVAGKFFLPGLGIVASSMSIVWTWGQRRLARRFVRKTTSRVEAANLLRRVIKVGVTLNLIGLLTSVLGAQYIVGTLVAKSMSSFVGFGGGGGLGGGIVTSQTLQPLDVLVVQANTNVLSSHFVSAACLLWLTRMVDLLDPPSLEEDDV